jgi:tRNA-splicing ligase RtcB
LLERDPAEYTIYGASEIETGAKVQMNIAMKLPVSVAGALMPDAHQGYGLPIGGVLATNNAVIPYGVGVDIGCRMALSIFDLPGSFLEENLMTLKDIILRNSKVWCWQWIFET